MEKVIEAALALILTLPDDPNDYPDMASFHQIQDKIRSLEKQIREYKAIKIN